MKRKHSDNRFEEIVVEKYRKYDGTLVDMRNRINEDRDELKKVALECVRSDTVRALRIQLQNDCNLEFGWRNEPKGSFNRWLLERLLSRKAPCGDPLIPTPEDFLFPCENITTDFDWKNYNFISPSLFREIQEDLPA